MKPTALFLMLAVALSRAEVEYELHTGYSSEIVCRFGVPPKGNPVPVVVTVTNEMNEPVKGAIVAIKRIEPGGYTEEDVRNTKDASTGADGRLTIDYPCRLDTSDPAKPRFEIFGAITVVAEGYETTAIECESYFAGIGIPRDERSALAARFVLKKKAPANPETTPAAH